LCASTKCSSGNNIHFVVVVLGSLLIFNETRCAPVQGNASRSVKLSYVSELRISKLCSARIIITRRMLRSAFSWKNFKKKFRKIFVIFPSQFRVCLQKMGGGVEAPGPGLVGDRHRTNSAKRLSQIII
jgi:hypothetical protein